MEKREPQVLGRAAGGAVVNKPLVAAGAINAAIAVAAGAFAAHGAAQRLERARSRSSRPARATTCITRSR